MIDYLKRTQIAAQLDQLSARGTAYLRRFALKESIERVSRYFFVSVLVVPSLYVLTTLGSIVANKELWQLSLIGTIVAAVMVPFAFVLIAIFLRFLSYQHDRRRTLALFDRELGYRDRIQTADEFLRLLNPSQFQEAAIADAERYIGDALNSRLDPIKISAPTFKLSNWYHGVTAVVLVIAGTLIGNFALPDRASADASELELLAEFNVTFEQHVPQEANVENDQPTPAEQGASADRKVSNEASDPQAFVQLSTRSEDKQGTDSSASSSAGISAGLAKQSQSGAANTDVSGKEADKFKKPRANERERKRDRKSFDQPRRKEENDDASAGIPGGAGANSGFRTSSSMTEAPDNKASQPSPDDELLDDAEDEEDEEQEASAASKPLINQRKAPADRSLSPSGVSDEENPDANGRGGPGGLKKTRGVAAMLLGVPLPDQLQGQINQGRMKVQRERDEPTEKSIAQVQAEFRGRSDESVGRIAHPAMNRATQVVVKNYFLHQRGTDTQDKE